MSFLHFSKTACLHALTLLVGQQEGHLACKNWVVLYWRGYLSGVKRKRFAYGPADATATSSSLAPVKSRITFLVLAYPGCPQKRPLNRCSSTSSWKKRPLIEKFSNSVPKGFTTTPINVLCWNFVKFGWREIGKVVLDLLKGLWSYGGFKLRGSGCPQIFSAP